MDESTAVDSLTDEGWSDHGFGRIFELAEPYLRTRNNDTHTRISYRWALRLLEQGGNPEVMIPAILLHDIGWSQVPEESQFGAMRRILDRPGEQDVHEREGVRIAADILDKVAYPIEFRATIISIIAGHDSKLACDSPEEAIVKDSDKLYRYSAEAVRWVTESTGLEPEEYLTFLAESAKGCFFTELGQRIAAKELATRRAELKRESASKP